MITKKTIKEKLNEMEKELVEAEISPKVGAEAIEDKMNNLVHKMGGKKKSKGKK